MISRPPQLSEDLETVKEEPFWERSEVVQRFADRDPDHRLVRMMEDVDRPERLRVLDLGCAGGRNSVFLARLGCGLLAVDSSKAMVGETRRRLASVLGRTEARDRTRVGRMDDLRDLSSGSVDLVLALGIYQNARNLDEWHRAVSETARVLRPGGVCLVAHFTPDLDLTGEGVAPVQGQPHTFTGLPGGDTCVLFYAPELDEVMARHGLTPVEPSRTVVVPTEKGRRATVNGLYVKG
jgi:SAM-dependent methyltransferase